MSKTSPTANADQPDWREARRQSGRDAIVDAAWTLVHEHGLAALSLRDLAKAAGITTPTVYAYFENKHAIYDAMFGRGMTEFVERMSVPFKARDRRRQLVEGAHRVADFCTSDVARYQLLFQRTIPGFEPSTETYAISLRAFDLMLDQLAAVGVTDARAVDMWSGLITGLVDQQISNDPGGTRWTRLIDDAVTMFLNHHAKGDTP